MWIFPIKFILVLAGTFLAVTVLLDIRPSSTSLQPNQNEPAPAEQPIASESIRDAKIGKVTMLYGNTNTLYERALKGQEVHNERFGYPMFTLREKTMPGYWSKPTYILQLMLAELAKPQEERLQWLFWVDGDIVLMNPNVPLEIFLPPEPEFSHIHLVVSNDHRGLNNGAFFIRVHEWSIWLFSAIVSLTTYEPHIKLKFGDQSAMQHVLEQKRFANNTIYVPQRWFNAYAGYRGKDSHDPFSKPRKYTANAVMEGDLQVHMAGGKSHREQYMTPYLDASEMHTDRWELPFERTTYKQEIDKFWKHDALKQTKGAVEQVVTTTDQSNPEDRVTEALSRARSRRAKRAVRV